MNHWPAPAKLNLFLHITGRRGDGYHELQTLFQLLDYGDELVFDLRDDGQINRIDPLPGVPVEADLCVRAARMLKETAGIHADGRRSRGREFGRRHDPSGPESPLGLQTVAGGTGKTRFPSRSRRTRIRGGTQRMG
jgi:hypothetical protein